MTTAFLVERGSGFFEVDSAASVAAVVSTVSEGLLPRAVKELLLKKVSVDDENRDWISAGATRAKDSAALWTGVKAGWLCWVNENATKGEERMMKESREFRNMIDA